jgi:hypothetical protein
MLRQESRVKLRRDSALSASTRARSDTSKEDVTSMMSLDTKSRESLKDKTFLLDKPETNNRGADIPKILVHKTFSREETMESNISDAAQAEEPR